jgi:hypothetical protein
LPPAIPFDAATALEHVRSQGALNDDSAEEDERQHLQQQWFAPVLHIEVADEGQLRLTQLCFS